MTSIANVLNAYLSRVSGQRLFCFGVAFFLAQRHSDSIDRANLPNFQLTDSPFYLGLEALCLGLPRVIFSALGGAVVDRADRKLIFVATQSAFLLMALFLGVMDHFDLISVWHLLAVSALTGFFVSVEQPVRQSLLHNLVPKADPFQRGRSLSDGFQWVDDFRTIDRRINDRTDWHSRMFLRCNSGNLIVF